MTREAAPASSRMSAGPAATVSYLLVGFMTLFTALSYCELAAAIPIAGGGYTFVHEAIGGFTAFITGWSMVFGLVVSAALYAIGFAEHLRVEQSGGGGGDYRPPGAAER